MERLIDFFGRFSYYTQGGFDRDITESLQALSGALFLFGHPLYLMMILSTAWVLFCLHRFGNQEEDEHELS